MKSIIVFVISFAILCSIKANAQPNVINICPLPADPTGCMRHWDWDSLPAKLPMGSYCCQPGYLFSAACEARTKACGASMLDNRSCDCLQNADGTCPCQIGKPIDVATGNTYITQTDISIPGLGGGLRLTRTWNSILQPDQGTFTGIFGGTWRSNYDQRLVFNSPDNYPKFAEGDGSVSSFGYVGMSSSGYNQYQRVSPGNDNTTTLTEGASALTIAYQNGESRTFDNTSGLLLSMSDRNGNVTQLTYDSSSRLITVTDPASRHLYFNYTGSSKLVSTVTSDIGISLSYTYDTQGRLTQVTKPDNTTISFVYDNNSRITSVLDAAGKVLESHTYDAAGRGLTSSRANGVDAVTVTYQQ